MYCIYRTHQDATRGSYRFKHETSFFGVRSGLIPSLLGQRMPAGQTEPYPWHLPIHAILGEHEETFIIDLKPRNKDRRSSLSLYELLDVWGYSAWGWTPAMVRLRGLVVDGKPMIKERKDFSLHYVGYNSPIYSFLYFAGGVGHGRLAGKWTAPRSSPTNSALLWPEALTYFVQQIRETTPEALKAAQ